MSLFVRPRTSYVNLYNANQIQLYRHFASDYQYLEHSAIPTRKFQKGIPKLPIPEVDKTVERYLSAVRPFVASDKQFENTKRIAEAFKNGEARDLHDRLVAYDKKSLGTSYITKWWFDMYLEDRTSIILNYNPFVALKDDPDQSFMKLPIRVTNMIISSLRFRRSLMDNTLSPEMVHSPKSRTAFYQSLLRMCPDKLSYPFATWLKALPMDMSQFDSLFDQTRIPRKGRDELKKFNNSRHVVFVKNGQFFAVDVLTSTGDIKPAGEIFSLVNKMANLSVDPNQESITTLTCEDRDVWAEARDRLTSSSKDNFDSLNMVDSAILVVCLDDLSFDMVRQRNEAAHNYLHGNSSRQEGRPFNRWLDKSFSLVFDREGHVAVNFEHSWGDGVTILRTFNDVFLDSTKNHFVGPEMNFSEVPAEAVRHLKFKLTPESTADVKKATDIWKSSTSKLDIHHVVYEKMGRDFLKRNRISPDSVFQLAFQMAFFKSNNRSVLATYESCSTAAFKHGRTEVIRPATMETKAASEAFDVADIKKDSQNLRKLLDACSKRHSTLAREAGMGHGCDRHLLGLRMIAQVEGLPKPAIFNDATYSLANHYVLSTSCLFGGNFTAGGFGPVVEDGYGVAYGFVDNSMSLVLSSYKGMEQEWPNLLSGHSIKSIKY